MALIICCECGKEFSDKAPACPQCGCPTEEARSKQTATEEDKAFSTHGADEKTRLLREYLENVRCLETDLYTFDQISESLNRQKRDQISSGQKQEIERAAEEEASCPSVKDARFIEIEQIVRQETPCVSLDRFADDYCRKIDSKRFLHVKRDILQAKQETPMPYESFVFTRQYEEKKKREEFWKERKFFILSRLSDALSDGVSKEENKDSDYKFAYEKYVNEIERNNTYNKKRLEALQRAYETECVVPYNRRMIKEAARKYFTESTLYENSVFNDALDYQLSVVDEEREKTKNALGELYGANILYEKYRGLVPVTMFCEYMDSGRRTVLEGIHGMYDLYESELAARKIVGELSEINRNLSTATSYLSHISGQLASIGSQLTGIARNQIMLHEEVYRGNTIADEISQNTRAILERASTMTSTISEIKTSFGDKLSALLSSSELTAHNAEVASRRADAVAKIEEYEFSLRHPSFPSP